MHQQTRQRQVINKEKNDKTINAGQRMLTQVMHKQTRLRVKLKKERRQETCNAPTNKVKTSDIPTKRLR